MTRFMGFVLGTGTPIHHSFGVFFAFVICPTYCEGNVVILSMHLLLCFSSGSDSE